MNGATVLVLLAVAAAAGFALRHVLRHRGGCDDCTGCGKDSCPHRKDD